MSTDSFRLSCLSAVAFTLAASVLTGLEVTTAQQRQMRVAVRRPEAHEPANRD